MAPEMTHVADGHALYSQGFTIGLNLNPHEALLAKVTENCDQAVVGGMRWHYNRGVLAALKLSSDERTTLRASRKATTVDDDLPTHVPDEIVTALQKMHPDPFVQAAILRIFNQAPGFLSTQTNDELVQAYHIASATKADWEEE